MYRTRVGAALCLLAVLGAEPAWAQGFGAPIPGLSLVPDPQELQALRRAPLTITPSLTITEEYNDNTGLDNRNRQWDLITGFTPALAITLERPTYRLAAGYSFTAELFARDTQPDHAFDRQSFVLDGLWRVTPQLTLTVNDTFAFNTDTNLIASEGVATGRDRAWSNTFGVGAGWQLDRLTTLRGGASYAVERFESSDLDDSDVYRAEVGLERTLTRQLSGLIAYQFGYFDIEHEGRFTTHTPRLGARWQPTATITLSLSGGPSFEFDDDGDSRVTPAVSAGYRQRLPFGAVSVSYDRAIGTAGGLGGTTDNQLAAAFVDVTTLARGLVVQLSPRYSVVESPHSDRVDVRSLTLLLQATYRLTDWMGLVAGYQFFQQRSDSTARSRSGLPIANDADQNRVFVGVQFGYPIRID